MSQLYDILRYLPLFTAAVWLFLAGFQVYRDRVHTWTERFFLIACLFTGLYAISDLVLFTARSGEDELAKFAAQLSLSAFTIVGLSFFLFTKVYAGRMKTRYFAAFLPAILFIPIVWTGTVVIVPWDANAAMHFVKADPVFFVPWLAVMIAFGLGGVLNLYRVDKIVRTQSQVLARRTRGLLLSFTIIFFLGSLTNGLINATQNTTIPPPFSTLLAIPGIFVAIALYPGTRERISVAMRRFKAKNYTIQSGFLIYSDGTLIDSASRPGLAEIDKDLFSATLDVIQNFMRTSFPVLAGRSLKTIEHGDLKILIERSRLCYLAIVLTGEENDLLRRQMRDELIEFEAQNREVLARWRGVQEDAGGAKEMFRRLFEPAALFPAVAQ